MQVRYPYESAAALHKEIRTLGDRQASVTVVDQFRLLITEIGNAMGYVRMVRAGGVHYTGETAQCLPDLPGVEPLPLAINSGGGAADGDFARQVYGGSTASEGDRERAAAASS